MTMKHSRILVAAVSTALLAPAASAQIYQFTRAEAVRTDVPGLEPRVDWIRDEPPVYDKQSYRVLAGDDYEPETAFVRFLPGSPAVARDGAHALAGIGDVLWTSRLVPDLYLVSVDRFDVEQTIQRYLDHPDTLYACPNYRSRRDQASNDPFFTDGTLWGMEGGTGPSHGGSNAEFAWDEHRGSGDITIAVVDSGVEFDHADLVGNHWTNTGEIAGNGIDDDDNGRVDDVDGWDFSDWGVISPGDNDPSPDCSDHGTHVAGTIGAQGGNSVGVVGVSWDCRLMALKCQTPNVCDSLSNTTLAFEYAVANGARVSNHSYGSPSFIPAQSDLILASQAHGHVFVTSAGNSWEDIDVTPKYPASYDHSNIISVANIESDGDLYEECFIFCFGGSSWGAVSVDLGAPGHDVYSTVNGGDYGYKTGTSMAAPHVAGAVGLIMSRYPKLEWWRVKGRIMNAARPQPTLEGKTVTGGMLDVHRALGVWATPASEISSPINGSAGNPWWTGSDDLFGLEVAVEETPDDGVLNLYTGVVYLDAVTESGLGNRKITIQASGGPVLLGIEGE